MLLGLGATKLGNTSIPVVSSGAKTAGEWLQKPQQMLQKPLGEVSFLKGAIENVSGAAASALDRVGATTKFHRKAETIVAEAIQKAQENAGKYGLDKAVGAVGQGVDYQSFVDEAQEQFTASRPDKDKKISLLKNPIERVKHGAAERKANNEFNAAVRSVEQVAVATQKQSFWQDPKQGIENRLSQMSVADAAGAVMRYGGVALQVHGGISHAKLNMLSLKQMMADVTGQDAAKISTFKMMFGSVPPVVAEARKGLIKGVLPRVALLIGGALAQEKIFTALHRRIANPLLATGASTMAFQAIEGLGSLADSKNAILPLYHAIHLAQHTKQPVGKEAYYQLMMVAASEDAKKHRQSLMLVANLWEAKQMPIAQAMQEINKGTANLARLSHVAKQELMPEAGQKVAQTQAVEATPYVSQDVSWLEKTGKMEKHTAMTRAAASRETGAERQVS
jgi:hypothetical protein